MMVPSIREVLSRAGVKRRVLDKTEVALLEREDQIADLLRTAGAQFGLFPEVVAEVICSIGIGTPVSEEERDLIRRSFVSLMIRLQQQQGD